MTRDLLWQGYQIAAATGGEPIGDTAWEASGFSIDTRTLQPGDVFVAIEAERDGHDFIAQAFKSGASAAIVTKAIASPGPLVRVGDSQTALEQLAAAARDRFFGTLIGVTGSAGKTTTKDMLRRALQPLGLIHAADKSFNNHLGVPLTMAALPPTAQAGIIEMGMNHAQEIRGLTTLVRPHIALITTIAEAHLENLGSLEAIADAKAEIAEGIRPGGAMILPADSPYLEQLSQRCREAGVGALLTFGKAGADARMLNVEREGDELRIGADVLGTEVQFRLATLGHHMASNALAALLAAAVAGACVKDAAEALGGFAGGEGRGSRYALALGARTVTILDESYNANPASMRAALSILSQAQGRRIAVLGDMKELGPTSDALHAELAPDVADAADLVHTIGSDTRHLREALAGGIRGSHAERAGDLLNVLLRSLEEGDTVLFKGSNASKVGELVQALLKAGQRR